MARTDNPSYFRPSVLIVNLPSLPPSYFFGLYVSEKKSRTVSVYNVSDHEYSQGLELFEWTYSLYVKSRELR